MVRLWVKFLPILNNYDESTPWTILHIIGAWNIVIKWLFLMLSIGVTKQDKGRVCHGIVVFLRVFIVKLFFLYYFLKIYMLIAWENYGNPWFSNKGVNFCLCRKQFTIFLGQTGDYGIKWKNGFKSCFYHSNRSVRSKYLIWDYNGGWGTYFGPLYTVLKDKGWIFYVLFGNIRFLKSGLNVFMMSLGGWK